jgi:hypothetical protein
MNSYSLPHVLVLAPLCTVMYGSKAWRTHLACALFRPFALSLFYISQKEAGERETLINEEAGLSGHFVRLKERREQHLFGTVIQLTVGWGLEVGNEGGDEEEAAAAKY